jgi:hypothetical protein
MMSEKVVYSREMIEVLGRVLLPEDSLLNMDKFDAWLAKYDLPVMRYSYSGYLALPEWDEVLKRPFYRTDGENGIYACDAHKT